MFCCGRFPSAGTLGEARAFQRRLPVRELALTALMAIVFLALIVALVWTLLWPGRHAAVAGGGSGAPLPGIGRDSGTGPQAGAGAGSSRDGAGQQGQGAQSALLAARIALGIERGVREFATETGEQAGPSQRNILRAGFEEAYLRPNWRTAS